MRKTRNPGGKSLVLLAVLATAAVSLSATVTYAGFQWVPPATEAPRAEAGVAPPTAPLAPAPAGPGAVLPLPGEQIPQQGLYVPPAMPGSPAATTAIPAAPQLSPVDAAAVSPAQRALALPPGNEAMPLLPPEEGNVMQVREVMPSPGSDTAPISITDTRQPVTMQNLSPPAMEQPQPAPAPVTINQPRVIMPEDAPQRAMDNTPNSQKLVINPLPDIQDDAQADEIQNAPDDFTRVNAVPSKLPVAEGFGSDMPLALALQQIVPAGYVASFDPGVNPGQTVSWDGGKPWDEVINDMLAPLQLQAVIGEKTVHIRSQQGWHQGDTTPAAPAIKDGLRRANIKDPGEQSQVASAVAGIESASGEPAVDSTAPAPAAAGPAQMPETIVEAETSPEQAEQLLAASEVAVEQTTPVKTNAGPWEAKAGESLRDILTRWSDKAGIELIWMASYDYKLKDDVALQENFSEAVEAIMRTGLEENSSPDFQLVQRPGDQAPGGILIRDKRA